MEASKKFVVYQLNNVMDSKKHKALEKVIKDTIFDRDYCHVAHFLSNTFTSQLQTAINEVEKEVTKREL